MRDAEGGGSLKPSSPSPSYPLLRNAPSPLSSGRFGNLMDGFSQTSATP